MVSRSPQHAAADADADDTDDAVALSRLRGVGPIEVGDCPRGRRELVPELGLAVVVPARHPDDRHRVVGVEGGQARELDLDDVVLPVAMKNSVVPPVSVCRVFA